MTQKPFYWTIFFALIVVFMSCNVQVKKKVLEEKTSESNVILTEQAKLIKTQGSKSGDNVHCSIQDKAGNLWFGTTSEGVYKYDGKVFTQFTESNGLISNTVHHILEDKEGKIWIATSSGICVYDGKTFSKIQIPVPKNQPINTYNNRKDVFNIIQDKSGKLWFATIDGVFVYDGNSFTHFTINEGASGFLSSNNNVEYILEDKAGIIWFGGRGNEGVFRYDGSTITNLKPDGDNWAWPVFQDKNGNIWFSNWNGAYRYDGNSFTSFTKKDGLSGDMVARIIEDKKGNLWFGGDGLSRYDGKSFTRFTTKDGLINNSIWSILESRNGNIWVGTRETVLFLYDGKSFIDFSE